MGWKHLQMDCVGGECERKQNESWLLELLKGKTINQVLLSCPSRKWSLNCCEPCRERWILTEVDCMKKAVKKLIKTGTKPWDFPQGWLSRKMLIKSQPGTLNFMEVVNNPGVNKFSHVGFNKNLNLNGNHRKKGEAEDWQQKYIALWHRRGKWCVIFSGSVKRRNQERQKMKT